MNRVILLLNLGVLVVNFVLAFSVMNSQIGIMRSTSDVAVGQRAPRFGSTAQMGSATRYLKVVQSLERIAPRQTIDKLSTDQLVGIHDAIYRYDQVVAAGVERTIAEGGDASELLRSHARLGEDARREIEQVLSLNFPNSVFVSRLATEIIKNCG